MWDVPKIVRERLQLASPAPANHPNADLLTAFAERSLPERERTTVIEHLSRCGDCREIVALALPTSEPIQTVLLTAHSNRPAWPLFRWAFISAGLAAITLFGIMRYERHSQPEIAGYHTPQTVSPEARNEAPGQPATRDQVNPSVEPKSQPTDRDASRMMATLSRNREPTSPSARSDGAKTLGGPMVRGSLAHGPRQMNQWQQQNANALQAAPAPAPALSVPDAKQQTVAQSSNAKIPASSEMVEVQGVEVTADGVSQDTDKLALANGPAAQQSGQAGNVETQVSRAKSAADSPSSKPAQPAPSQLPLQGRSFQAVTPTAPTWTITSGRLRRSVDQGATWQEVNVAANLDGGASVELLATSKAMDSLSTAEKKQRSTAPFFRAVASNDSDVWAGGSGALLYHSSDAGVHWIRVIPSSPNATLTGDIVRLEFPDPQNGRISTSTDEIWITADGGQTWQKQ